ncbi:LacI family transcriptional regulator [Enemella evansiae]|uniref:LacI family transcriptional regulator n=2 Tax=Enemella evansiae TaxID=2016499 RepID=A0A255G534_9ACTN|nr:LacI family transcriptional regulator [Enemella evansiae]OYO14923.1 LacI family transcriptional regulator [Enemella evansiae]
MWLFGLRPSRIICIVLLDRFRAVFKEGVVVMPKATLKSVAAEVGVSPATVSNAYNRPDQLSVELRERVFETAKRLGYPGPNPTARNLRSGRTGSFGVLYNHSLSHAFSDPFASMFLAGLGGAVEDVGSGLLLIPLKAGDREVDVDVLRRTPVDGLADVCLTRSQAQQVQEIATQREIPFVSSVCDDPAIDHIGLDDFAGGRMMGEHLALLGHRRVAIVLDFHDHAGPVEVIAVDRLSEHFWARIHGLIAGLDGAEVTLVDAGWNAHDTGYRAGGWVLDQRNRPTAIVGVSDVMALGVLDAARERGVDVPRELSIVGFDDIPAAGPAGLTTLAQPITERGELVGKLLLDPKRQPRQVILPTEVKVRRTTGPANERNS